MFVFLIEALRSDVIFHTEENKEITPFLNSLAKQGYLFSNAYSPSAESSYGQVATIFGQHPFRYQLLDAYTQVPDYPSFRSYDLFCVLGYKTARLTNEWASTRRITASEHASIDFDPTYDPISKVENYLSKETVERNKLHRGRADYSDRVLLEVLTNWVKDNPSPTPKFASLYLSSSHFPYTNNPEMNPFLTIPEEVLKDIRDTGFLYYKKELAPQIKRAYFNSLRYVDDLIRSFFTVLEDLGEKDNTVLVIAGDHGEAFYEHESIVHNTPLHQEVIKVPLIVWGANHLCPSVPLSEPVSLIDVQPTILAAASLPPSEAFQGISLLSTCQENKVTSCERPVVSVNQLLGEYAVILGAWKYIENKRTQSHRLFHLLEDPAEQSNLISTQPKIAEMMRKLLRHFENTQFSYYLGPAARRQKFFPPPLRCMQVEF